MKFVEKKQAIQDAYGHGNPIDFSLIHSLEGDLARLLEEEEIYWHQRSRENWLRWGDRNTKWFHHKASECRKRNTIRGIMRTDGVWVDSESDVESVFIDYFQFPLTFLCPNSLLYWTIFGLLFLLR